MVVKWHRTVMLSLVCLVLLALAGCGPSDAEIRAEDVDTAEVIAWIEETAFPLVTTELVDDTADLEWLREAVGDAKVVGLGDQTNGTKESVTLNNRITEFLLEEMGFSAIAITISSWGHSLTVDRFVSEGKGRARGAREGLTYPFDFSQVFLDFLAWAGRYSQHYPDTPLHMVGVNPLSPHTSFEWCKNILLGKGCTLPQTSLRMIERLEYGYSKIWGDRDRQSEYFAQATELMGEIQEILPDYADKLTVLELAIIERIPRAIEQLEEYLEIADSESKPNAAGWHQQAFDFYNQCMAENVSWWLGVLGDDTKIIVWGHNSEIAKQWPEAAVTPLGQQLSTIYGAHYVSLGFSAGEGIVHALQRTDGNYAGYGQGLIPEPIQDSYETVLCSTSLVDYVLDLRDLDPESDVSVWMNESRPFKLLGDNRHTIHKYADTAFNTPHTLPKMFDLILHVQFTRGIESVY